MRMLKVGTPHYEHAPVFLTPWHRLVYGLGEELRNPSHEHSCEGADVPEKELLDRGLFLYLYISFSANATLSTMEWIDYVQRHLEQHTRYVILGLTASGEL
jgi:hypothetical protein